MHEPHFPIHHLVVNDEKISFNLHPLERSSEYNTGVPHRHSYFEIFFFKQGGGFHFIDFRDFPIDNHSVHFVAPGQVHMVRREPGSFGSVILFSEEFYHTKESDMATFRELPFLNYNSDVPYLSLEEGQFSRLYTLVGEIREEMEYKDALREQLIHGSLNLLLLHCRRLHNAGNPQSEAKPPASNIRKFLTLLETNFMSIHQPSWYAEQLSLTEKHLNEVIKKWTGGTLTEKIQQRLLLEAKRLLLHSELSFKEIAWELHFEDPSYFTKFFKRSTGQTPSEFREGIRRKYEL